MSDIPPFLQDLARELEHDKEIVRIKKLLLLACTGHWESDGHKIALLDTARLLQRLHSLSPTVDRLSMRLKRAAAHLNKPQVYGVIADRISKRITNLFAPTDAEPTRTSTEPRLPVEGEGERTLLSFQGPGSSSTPEPPTPEHETQTDKRVGNLAEYNWFAIRFELLRATNPLRVKILSFFTLDPQTSFNAYTWASIKSELLDRLLYRLCEACPTLDDLESRLQSTVNRFPEVEEYAQAAESMIRVLDRVVYSADPEPNQLAQESFGATGRFPGFELFGDVGEGTQLSSGLPTPGSSEDDESERSMFAVENIFTRARP
ncbi:MAG: hypothetical protein EA001_09625 [Oscillatoriales cyanobacterium]|nr:MAG: hypothetical protein EA001_09625 [Oscillatoriales cyanobacterium]